MCGGGCLKEGSSLTQVKNEEKKNKPTLVPNGDKSISWHSNVLSDLDKEVVITTCAFLMAQPSTFPNESNLPTKRQLNIEYQQQAGNWQ